MEATFFIYSLKRLSVTTAVALVALATVAQTPMRTDNLLPGQIHTQAVSSNRYNAFPGLTLLNNGSLLLAWYGSSSHTASDSKLYSKLSYDQGRTWSSEVVVLEESNTNISPRDVELTTLRNGTVLLSFFKHFGTNLDYDVFIMRGSLTHMNTMQWETPVQVATTNGMFTRYNACSSKVLELPDGSLLLPIYGENADSLGAEKAGVVKSLDGGLTWGLFVQVGVSDYTYINEAGTVLLPSGRIVMLLRGRVGVPPTNPAGYHRTVSDDGGATWTPVLPSMTNIITIGRPTMILLGSGGIVLISRNGNTNTPAANHSASYWTSWDEGLTWSHPTTLNASLAFVYSSAVLLSAGEVATVQAYESNGDGSSAHIEYQNLLDRYVKFSEGHKSSRTLRVGQVASDLIPSIPGTYSVGALTSVWANVYTRQISGDSDIQIAPSGDTWFVTGGVGIGSPPESIGAGYGTLDIRGYNGGGVRFGVSGSTHGYAYSTSGYLELGTTANIPMLLSPNGVTAVDIRYGNVGIGTIPESKLDVAGDIRARGFSVGALAGITTNVNVITIVGSLTNQLQFTKGILTAVVPK